MRCASGSLGASLKRFARIASPASRPQLSRAHQRHLLQAQLRFSTSRPTAEGPLATSPWPRSPSSSSSSSAAAYLRYDCLPARPHAPAPATMFEQAVQRCNAIAAASPPKNGYKQKALGSPSRKISVASQRPSKPVPQGIKRTSSGLAKSLGSQEDAFDYATLSIAGIDKENEVPTPFYNPTALFDENDFDSDIDLDVEDPATKGTVTCPPLPGNAPVASRTSSYASQSPAAQPQVEDSSQPAPWSSSPPEHFKTPPKPASKTKRRQLPWGHSLRLQPVTASGDQIEEDDVEGAQPKRIRSAEPEKPASTPAPKEATPQYPFNVTASGLKQQQKVFREQMKAQTKSAQTADDAVKEAIKKKKQNKIHRIFLSEEQQNVLNLVTEYKKSVFFTGSAGMRSSHFF